MFAKCGIDTVPTFAEQSRPIVRSIGTVSRALVACAVCLSRPRASHIDVIPREAVSSRVSSIIVLIHNGSNKQHLATEPSLYSELHRRLDTLLPPWYLSRTHWTGRRRRKAIITASCCQCKCNIVWCLLSHRLVWRSHFQPYRTSVDSSARINRLCDLYW